MKCAHVAQRQGSVAGTSLAFTDGAGVKTAGVAAMQRKVTAIDSHVATVALITATDGSTSTEVVHHEVAAKDGHLAAVAILATSDASTIFLIVYHGDVTAVDNEFAGTGTIAATDACGTIVLATMYYKFTDVTIQTLLRVDFQRGTSLQLDVIQGEGSTITQNQVLRTCHLDTLYSDITVEDPVVGTVVQRYPRIGVVACFIDSSASIMFNGLLNHLCGFVP